MKRTVLADGAYTIDDVLTPEECVELIARTEKIGFEVATINTLRGARVELDTRNNDRVIIDDVSLAAMLWGRIVSEIPAARAGRQVRGLNERFRFYRYSPGQKFAWHMDGAFTRENGETGRLTMLIYLNEGYCGGETEFDTNADRPLSVIGRRGMALFFEHEFIHQGAPLLEGTKYVIRSDVMYGPIGQYRG